MNLTKELKSFNSRRKLGPETRLKVLCTNGKEFLGSFEAFTAAENNEPEVAQLDIRDNNGFLLGLLETEIEAIKVI